MTSGLELDFIVAGGARYGLGHVMRSSTLARAAMGRGWRVRAFLAGDRAASGIWRGRCPETSVLAWSAWRARRAAAVTVFDHPFAKSRWLVACRSAPTRSVVLDDLQAIGRARLTIHPALHHLPDAEAETGPPEPVRGDASGTAPSTGDAPDANVLRGPRYAILDEDHRATPHTPLAARHALLLSLGGADPHRATPRLAPILADTLTRLGPGHGVEVRHVVLGPAFADPEGAVARTLAAAGWRVERALAPAAMAARMAGARLAVIGFGTSLCELAWHGTPHLSLTHHEADASFAQRLERRGIGRWLGHAASFEPAAVEARLERALCEPRWQRDSADRARALLEGGHGCERILDRIAALADAAAVPASTSEAAPSRNRGRSGGRGRGGRAAMRLA